MRRNDQNVNVPMEFRVILLPCIQATWSLVASSDSALLASGDVLRGSTQHLPKIHASGMATCLHCLTASHLRAYRVGTGEMLLHLV